MGPEEVSLRRDTPRVVQAVCFTALALEFFQEVLLITLHIHQLTPGCQFPGGSVLHNHNRNGITRAGEGTQSEKYLLCKHEDMSVNPGHP